LNFATPELLLLAGGLLSARHVTASCLARVLLHPCSCFAATCVLLLKLLLLTMLLLLLQLLLVNGSNLHTEADQKAHVVSLDTFTGVAQRLA
jgi:hypothetical protein